MDKSWIAGRISAAKQTSSVPDEVASALSQQLNGTMSERALRPGELTSAAQKLLQAAVAPPPKGTAQ